MTNSDPPSLMPLRMVVARTGVNAETIRAWERRYDIVKPVRTPGGTRRFTEEDVRRLLFVRELREAGHSLRKLASLSNEELAHLARAEKQEAPEPPLASIPPLTPQQRDYLTAIEKLEATQAAEILEQLAFKKDNLSLLIGVAIPIMWQVGRRWTEGSLGTAQERLVSTQLRRLLMSRLEQIRPPAGAKKLLFTTPAGQLHEFGILAGSVLAAEAGFDVLYLGPNLPTEEIIWSVAQSQADVLVLSVVRKMDEPQIQQMERLVFTLTPRVPIWVGCPPGHPLRSRVPKATCISTLEEFQKAAASLIEQE